MGISVRWRRAGQVAIGGVGLLVLGLLALSAGWYALTAMARVSERPAAILSVALLTGVLVLVAGGWALSLLIPPSRRRRTRVIAAAVVAAVLIPLGYGTLAAPPERTSPPPPAGTQFWQLPDGHRLAALSVPAAGPDRGDPVVFLHGGPGVADLGHDAQFFGQLAGTGRDVWLYDQLGAGHSDRLADPTGYSLERDLADLEEVRKRIDAERVVLIGFSYGATLATNYLARHPDRVERLILISPGRLVPEADDLAGTGMVGRLSPRQQLALASVILPPRVMAAWGMSTVNPRAAHNFAGDREMDARFEEVFRVSAPGLVCDGHDLPPTPPTPGYYANQVPLNSQSQYPDIRPTLAGLATPVLVIKGGCDYLPWSFVADYGRSLPGSQLVYFDDAGHLVYFEQPERSLAVLRAFLTDSPLPVPRYDSLTAPASYRGGH